MIVLVLSFYLVGTEQQHLCEKKTPLVSLTAKKGRKKAAISKDLSDMDYLKSKVVEDSSSSSSTEDETGSEEAESESEEDSGIAENSDNHTEKRGKPKAQQTCQEVPVQKKTKGSALEVKLN